MGGDDWKWWLCKCGGWTWCHKPACVRCKAPPPKWVLEQRAQNSKSSGPRVPSTITVGDFILLGNGKKARKQAKKLEAVLAERDELRAKIPEPPAAASTDKDSKHDDGDQEMDPSSTQEAQDSVLLNMSDEDLEAVLKIAKSDGLPGREAYLTEQARRREAKFAGKATWQRVRAVEEKWKKIKGRVTKAEQAVKDADSEVHKAKEEAKRAIAAAEAKAAAARQALDELREEESKSESLFNETRAKEIDQYHIPKYNAPLQGFVEKLNEYRGGFPEASSDGRRCAVQMLRESFEHLLLEMANGHAGELSKSDMGVSQNSLAVGSRPPGAEHAVAVLAAEAEAARAGIYRSPGTASAAATMAVEASELRGRPRKLCRFSPYADGSRRRASSADAVAGSGNEDHQV